MPVYMYTARNTEGKLQQGKREAASEVMAINQLQNEGLFVTQILNTATTVKVGKSIGKKRRQRISAEDMIFFISQTANLLTVGIPFVRALEVISDQIESAELHKVIQEMITNIRAGSTFKDALARHPKIFPQHWTYVVEAGELSGNLPIVLTRLAKSMEANEHLKKKVVSALVYPAVLVSASIGAIIIFMIFVIPVFERLFTSFHAKLPALTQGILDVSHFLRSYYLIVIGGVIGGYFFLKKYLSTPVGQRSLNILFLSLPIFGPVMNDIVHTRICMILAMMVRSGLSLLKSLEVTARVSGNFLFENALENTRLDVQQGQTLSSSLAQNTVFSNMFIHLVKIGEESGKLPEMIDKAGEYFQARVDVFAARVGVLMEPLIMVIIGGVIGTIVVAMFLPIMKMSSAMH